MKRWNSYTKRTVASAIATVFIAGSAQANLWFEPSPVDALTAAQKATGSYELAQTEQAKTPAQIALEEANDYNVKKKKKQKKKKKKKRRGSFK